MRMLVCALVLLPFAVAASPVYKCEVAGKITYQDKPCDGSAREEVVNSREAAKAAAVRAEEARDDGRVQGPLRSRVAEPIQHAILLPKQDSRRSDGFLRAWISLDSGLDDLRGGYLCWR